MPPTSIIKKRQSNPEIRFFHVKLRFIMRSKSTLINREGATESAAPSEKFGLIS